MEDIKFFGKYTQAIQHISLVVLGLSLITLLILKIFLFYKDVESMKEIQKEEQVKYIEENNGGIVVDKSYIQYVVKIIVKDTILSIQDEWLFEFSEKRDSIFIKDGKWKIKKN